MARKTIGAGILACLLFLASGCSVLLQQAEETDKGKGKSSAEKSASSKPVLRWTKFPESLREVRANEKAGRYAGDQYDLNRIRPALDKLPKGTSPEAVYDRLLQLVAEDYSTHVKKMENYDTSIIEVKGGPGTIRNLEVPEDEEINMVILLDASGSMAGKVKDGTKMDLAKQAIREFVANMPQGANVSLQVYGHKGSNAKKDKKRSCSSVEEVYPLGEYRAKAFNKSLESFKPAGWTPLGAAMEKARGQLKSRTGDGVQNTIYVVSDGVETCGGDPVKQAEALHTSQIQTKVNIIGFDVDDKGQKALQDVADAGGGTYKTVGSKVGLKEYFEGEYSRLYDQWQDWASDHYDRAQVIGSIKYDDLQKRGEALDELAEKEKVHLNEAISYLEERRKFPYDTVSDVEGKIFDREKAIEDYVYETRDRLQSEVIDNRDEIQSGVIDKRDAEQEEINDARND
ncbi:VWA domain-containing protein [Salinithrix halophila]|uniref:VWA domain-containing protein n=1 Tax=Salinithrix halophila TaxID=1485204 RepID=A0ABV8JEV4_9BACL